MAWILAKNRLYDEVVKVRQIHEGSNIFVDENGCKIKIRDLDFTEARYDLPPLPSLTENHKDNVKELKEIINSFDVKEQDNNRAEIAKREYWRKLRGDIFLSIHKEYVNKNDALVLTKEIFDALYEQDVEFRQKKV